MILAIEVLACHKFTVMVTHYIPTSGMKGGVGCIGLLILALIILAIGAGALLWIDWALRSLESLRV